VFYLFFLVYVGSDLTWQLQAYAGYRFGKVFQLTAGYRILSIDYDKVVDKERFIYNVDTFGSVLRFGFNFEKLQTKSRILYITVNKILITKYSPII
jgi:hypothetical protein